MNGRHRSSAVPLAAAYALLVLYASLYPFSDWRWPPGQDLATLLALSWPPWRHDFDSWSNWLGYVPLGALLHVGARRSGLGAARALLLALAGAVQAQEFGDTPYVQTPQNVVDAMLETAKVTAKDFVIDLGSGDGRMVITAAKKRGARGFGDRFFQIILLITCAAFSGGL